MAVKADGELFEITTYLAGKAVDAQMVASAGDFQENGWITLEGSGSLGEASVTLTGGTDGENPEAADYEAALAAYELCDFDVIVYCGEDTGVKAKLIPWVKTAGRTNSSSSVWWWMRKPTTRGSSPCGRVL